MVLSKYDIKERCECEKDQLIDPVKIENIQTCSYDLTFGGEYYYYDPKHGDQVVVSTLTEYEKLYIPGDAICYVMSEEIVNMPNDLTASISLAFGLIKAGVMLSNQPPFDPGYRGKVVALLHNLSHDPICIERGKHILNIVFYKLSKELKDEDLYNGSYQDLNTLKKYCTQVRKGGIYVLANDFRKQKKKFVRFLPFVIEVITVIIAAITILITFLTISTGVSGCEAKKTETTETTHTEEIVNSQGATNNSFVITESDNTKKIRINLENNNYSISIDGDVLTIDFENKKEQLQ